MVCRSTSTDYMGSRNDQGSKAVRFTLIDLFVCWWVLSMGGLTVMGWYERKGGKS